jgi:hypothetical protein
MDKKTLDMHYTSILKMEEQEVTSHFWSSFKEKIVNTVGAGHKVAYEVDITKRQMVAIIDGDIKIIAKLVGYNVRTESLTKMPEVMKLYQNAKRELEAEYADNLESLSILKPVMYIYGCTLVIGTAEDNDKKYDSATKKLIDRITVNKTIILLR